MGTRGAWTTSFLQALGNNRSDENIERFVSAWTKVENTEARYNPLATTLDYGRWTNFNSVGVKNYSSYQEGIEASVATLQGDHLGYRRLLEGLQNNDVQECLMSGGLDTWGSGSARVGAIYALGDTRGEELKSDSGTAASGANPPTVSDTQPHIDPTLPTQQQTVTGNAPGVSIASISEDDVRLYAKMALGIGLIGVASLLFIITLLRTDAAKQAANIAVKAAIV